MVFVGSYLPLSLILLVQDIDFALLCHSALTVEVGHQTNRAMPFGKPWMLCLVVLCLVCFILTLFIFRLAGKKARASIKIEDAKHVPSELIGYTLPYVVSFMKADLVDESGLLLGLATFLVWFFCITYRSGQIVLNPLLAVFGWRLYEVRYHFIESRRTYVGKAFSRNVISSGDRCLHTAVDDVMVIGRITKEGHDDDAR